MDPGSGFALGLGCAGSQMGDVGDAGLASEAWQWLEPCTTANRGLPCVCGAAALEAARRPVDIARQSRVNCRR